MKRASIKDVAKEAGVSTTTVSYVLNRKPSESISAETTTRVLEAVKRLRYVPNLNARSLSSRRSNLIGVVIPQTEPGKEFMFSNPFYGDLLSSLEYTARKRDYHVLISGTEPGRSYLSVARNRGVDGIIIVGAYPTRSLEELHELSIPIVLIDTYVKDPVFHTIGIDDRLGGCLATRHLIENGHRRIAFVSGSVSEQGVMQKRFLGYMDALSEAGIQMEEKHLYLGNVSYEFGVQTAREIQARGNGETAAFATADVIGMGLVNGARQIGCQVPDDLSVIGFDDVSLARMCVPQLTTVCQNIATKGSRAVEIILDALAGRPEKQEHILPIELARRESVRNIHHEEARA